MANDLQNLRRSGVVSTFGPGAVVDFRADNAPVSGLAAGLEEWDRSFPPAGLLNPQVIREPRLQKKLGVAGFRLPPVLEERRKDEDPDGRRLVAVRFPGWLQCPTCDLIGLAKSWSDEPGKAYRFCHSCTGKTQGPAKTFVIPVRFVLACSGGHIDEFPWHWWVGHDETCQNRSGTLRLRSESPGLAGVILSCPKCSAKKSMDGIFSKQTWERFRDCTGHRPWLSEGDEACSRKPVAVQRGASNLYFPVTHSALSIPPWEDRLQDMLGTYWDSLVNVSAEQRANFIQMLSAGDLGPLMAELKLTPAGLAEAVERRLHEFGELDTDDLKPAEYRQFLENPAGEGDGPQEFEIRREYVPAAIEAWVSSVVRAVRLREVRAITGFTRINPPGDPESPDVQPLSQARMPWYPAIEVRGEGIFLALNESRVAGWEQHDAIKSRVSGIDQRYREDWASRHGEGAIPPRKITPRFLLCHTLSHVLMRQLTLECGYSSAALQERIYAGDGDEKMAGLLIYTATSDADGTLGGLQRQGEASRIAQTLHNAIAGVEWCSSDPLCISDMMGAEASFSHSACHSCVLVPETSCEEFNYFLDRGLLVGTPDHPETGFFSTLLSGHI